jgi:hypothetical protein
VRGRSGFEEGPGTAQLGRPQPKTMARQVNPGRPRGRRPPKPTPERTYEPLAGARRPVDPQVMVPRRAFGEPLQGGASSPRGRADQASATAVAVTVAASAAAGSEATLASSSTAASTSTTVLT